MVPQLDYGLRRGREVGVPWPGEVVVGGEIGAIDIVQDYRFDATGTNAFTTGNQRGTGEANGLRVQALEVEKPYGIRCDTITKRT